MCLAVFSHGVKPLLSRGGQCVDKKGMTLGNRQDEGQAHPGLENQTMPAPNTRKLPTAPAGMEDAVSPVECVEEAREMGGTLWEELRS